jgi:hypothetical protein
MADGATVDPILGRDLARGAAGFDGWRLGTA